MVTDLDLKEVQRRVYMSFFEDGVWDIFLGLFVLGWGLAILTDAAYLPGVSFVVIYSSIWGIKRWLTYPRIGFVRFSATSRRKITARFLILGMTVFLLGILVSIFWGLSSRPQWLVDYFPVIFCGMFAVIVCLAAYWFIVNRFYLHAALIFLGAAVHQWLDIRWEFGFIGSGSVILLIGLGFLMSFLHKYPKTVGGAPGDER